jgi:hypothetical protein
MILLLCVYLRKPNERFGLMVVRTRAHHQSDVPVTPLRPFSSSSFPLPHCYLISLSYLLNFAMMNSTTTSLSKGPPQAPFACVRCSERKVKCDKQSPCTTCVRHKIQCIYRTPKPSRRRRARDKEALVDERLKHYETLLQENGIDPHQVDSIPAIKAPQPVNHQREPDSLWPAPNISVSEYRATYFKPQLLQGQSGAKLVDK